MDKLKMHSPNLTEANIAKLAELFPNCITEARDAKGKLKKAIDFDLLRQELSSSIVEGPQERYQLNWPGKREALLTANAPIAKTLRPCREESVDFETTQNLFIEGDNLDVLKLLQETYLNKVKMIYIDPPYNTGKDFIYEDDFAEELASFLERSNQKDDVGHRLVSNSDASGRFHSDWLTMMYSRLRLAHKLLTDDGLIFVSIDDNEMSALKIVLDEVFGSSNYCATFVWNTEGNTDNQYKIKVNHEYVVAYYRDIDFSDRAIGRVIDPNTREDSNLWKGVADNNINKNNPENPPSIVELPAGFPCAEEELFYQKKDIDNAFFARTEIDKFISDPVREEYGIEKKTGLPVKLDDMVVKDFKLQKPCRIYVGMANKNKLLEFIRNGCETIFDDGLPLRFYINSNAAVRYHRENDRPRNILSVLRNMGTTEKSKTALKSIGVYYDYPKPVSLLEYLIKIGCEDDKGIILDFFAGSGTTAHAVMNLNASEGAARRFICVQLPELTSDKSDAKIRGFNNLADICKKRLAIVSGGLAVKEHDLLRPEKLNTGFRVLKVDSSNMKEVYYKPDNVSQDQLFDQVDNIREDRTSEDLLFQVLLDWGVDLALPISQQSIAGKTVFFVDGNALAACFDTGIDEDFVKQLSGHKPLRVVFRDAGFASDSVKINVEQVFKLLSPATEIKTL